MDRDLEKALEAQEALSQILGQNLSEITESIAGSFGDDDNPYTIQLPEEYAVDLPLEELASYVARSANKYGRAARSAGIARAQSKLAKGRFENKFKRSRVGKNDIEREKAAMEACQTEHAVWTLAESVAEVIGGIEAGARVASESSRKIFGAAESQQMAANRENRGAYRDQDFRG